MADDKVIDTSVTFQPGGWGAYREVEGYTPERDTGLVGVLNYGRDTAIDLARGIAAIPHDVAGAATALPGTDAQRASRRETQEYYATLDRYFKQGKSERGQFVEEHNTPTNIADKVFQGVVGIVPYLPIAATGPAAPVVGAGVFGATSFGASRNAMSDALRFMEPNDFKDENGKFVPEYQKYLSQGLSHNEIKERLYDDTNTLESGLASGLGGAVGGGMLGTVGGKLGSRLLSEAMGNKIMQSATKRFGLGAAEGALGGAAQGGGLEYARQRGLQGIGLHGPVDWGDVAKSAGEQAEVLGLISGGARVLHKPKVPAPIAPEVGTAEKATAKVMADNTQPAYPDHEPLGGGRYGEGDTIKPPEPRPAWMPEEPEPVRTPEGVRYGEETPIPEPPEQKLARGPHMIAPEEPRPAWMPEQPEPVRTPEGVRYGEDQQPERGTLPHLYAMRDQHQSLGEQIANRQHALDAKIMELDGGVHEYPEDALASLMEDHGHDMRVRELDFEQRQIERMMTKHEELGQQVAALRRELAAARGVKPPPRRAKAVPEEPPPEEPPPEGGAPTPTIGKAPVSEAPKAERPKAVEGEGKPISVDSLKEDLAIAEHQLRAVTERFGAVRDEPHENMTPEQKADHRERLEAAGEDLDRWDRVYFNILERLEDEQDAVAQRGKLKVVDEAGPKTEEPVTGGGKEQVEPPKKKESAKQIVERVKGVKYSRTKKAATGEALPVVEPAKISKAGAHETEVSASNENAGGTLKARPGMPDYTAGAPEPKPVGTVTAPSGRQVPVVRKGAAADKPMAEPAAAKPRHPASRPVEIVRALHNQATRQMQKLRDHRARIVRSLTATMVKRETDKALEYKPENFGEHLDDVRRRPEFWALKQDLPDQPDFHMPSTGLIKSGEARHLIHEGKLTPYSLERVVAGGEPTKLEPGREHRHSADVRAKAEELLRVNAEIARQGNEVESLRKERDDKQATAQRQKEAAQRRTTEELQKEHDKAAALLKGAQAEAEDYTKKRSFTQKIRDRISVKVGNAMKLINSFKKEQSEQKIDRKFKSAAAKRKIRATQFAERERIAKEIVMDWDTLDYPEQEPRKTGGNYPLTGDIFEEGFKRTQPRVVRKGKVKDEDEVEGADVRRYQKYLAQVERLSVPDLHRLAEKMRDNALVKFNAAEELLGKYAAEQRASGRGVHVVLEVGDRAATDSPWFSRLTDYPTFIEKVEELIKGGAKRNEELRDLLTDHYIDEVLAQHERISEVDKLRRMRVEETRGEISDALQTVSLTSEQREALSNAETQLNDWILDRAGETDTTAKERPQEELTSGLEGYYSALGKWASEGRVDNSTSLVQRARELIAKLKIRDSSTSEAARAQRARALHDYVAEAHKETLIDRQRAAEAKAGSVQKAADEQAAHEARTRGIFLIERATKLWDALNHVRPEVEVKGADVLEFHREFRKRIGEEADPKATEETITADRNRIEDELGKIEDEMRELFEKVVPFAKDNDVGIGGIFEPGPLRAPGALPRGAYVHRVSDFTKRGDRFYGIRPGPEIPTGKIRNHFMSVADHLVGHVDIVTLTHEQWKVATLRKGLPPETPAFFDPQTDRIFISREAMASAKRGEILGHEIGHAISESGFQMYPEFRKLLNEQRLALKKEYDGGRIDLQLREILDGHTQGLDNVHEFFSHLWNNPAYGEALHLVGTTEAQRAKWQTEARTAKVKDIIGNRAEWAEAQREARLKGDPYSKVWNGIGRTLSGMFWQASKKRLLNDATIASMDMMQRMQHAGRPKPNAGPRTPVRPIELRREKPLERRGGVLGAFTDFGREVMAGATERAKDFHHDVWRNGGVSGIALKTQMLDSLVRTGDKGMQAVTQPISDLKGQHWATQQDITNRQDKPVARMMSDVFRNHTAEHNKAFMDYIDQVNYAGVSGAHDLTHDLHKHLPTDASDLMHRHYVEQHAKAKAAWDRLSPDQQVLAEKMREYYDTRDEDIRQKLLRTMVTESEMVTNNHPEATEALIKHLTGEQLSQHETMLLADHVPGFAGHRDASSRTKLQQEFIERRGRIRGTGAFRRLSGPYFPMTRHGDWVVHARYDLGRHAEGGVELNPDETGPERTWEFAAKDKAAKFIKTLHGDDGPGVKVIRTREVAYEPDPNDPTKPLTVDGKAVRAGSIYEDEHGNVQRKRAASLKEAKDVDPGEVPPVIRWQVDVNPHLTEMHETRRSADARVDDLKSDPDLDVRYTAARRESAGTYVNPAYASKAMREFIAGFEKTKGYSGMPNGQVEAAKRMMYEVAERQMLTTSARSRYTPRRYSLGANKDALKSFQTYSHNTSHTLSELAHRKEMNDAVEAMDEYVKANQWRKDPGEVGYDAEVAKYGTKRTQIQNEMHSRIAMRTDPIMRNAFDKITNIMLKLSFFDKLGSPSFPLLNSSEPWLIAGPIMAAEHGAKTYDAIRRAYDTVGAGKQFGAGISDFKKIWAAGLKGDAELHDNLGLITTRVMASDHPLKADIVKALETISSHGYLDRDAGMEMSNFHNIDAGPIERRINFMDDLVRSLNSQVESINRSVTAVAAYELARGKGMSHDAATHYAQVKVAESAGNYAAYNKSPLFNNRWLRPALQFRQFSARMTDNWVRAFVNAGRGNPGQLIWMLASQSLVAGVLGLPTEPFKAAITAANALGISPYNTDDVEAIVRQGAAGWLGQDGGEIFTRGVFRYLGTGLGERAASNSLWTQGTLGQKPDAWYTAAGHMLLGSPGSTGIDAIQGSGKIISGMRNYLGGADTLGGQQMAEGMRQALPFKLGSDVFGSAYDAINPPRTKGGAPRGEAPGLGTMVSNALGIRTGAQLEQYEASTASRRAVERYGAQKHEAVRAYVMAPTEEERSAIERGILGPFNEGRPDDEKITVPMLRIARRNWERNQSLDPSLLGVSFNKHTRGFAPSREVYGF